MTASGGLVEVQATAEQEAFKPEEFDALMALAKNGIADLILKQNEALK